MKNYWALVFATTLLFSCNYVQKELPNSQELLRRELHMIDWSKVDTYPTYESCDKLKTNDELKACFFDKLYQEVVHVLKTDSLVRISTIDSVQFLVTITPESQLSFKTQKINETLLPKTMLDSVMQAHQKDFTKIQPAIKRGIPVRTQFNLPVVFEPVLD